MRIYEFIDKYCRDILEENESRKKLVDLTMYPYDIIETDVEGNKFPAIIIDTVSVAIQDVLTMSRDEFVDSYKLPSAGTAYDNYIRLFKILEGESALNQLLVNLKQASSRIVVGGGYDDFGLLD